MSPRRLGSLATIIVTIGLILVIWSFFVLVPYDTIPNKPLFWSAFLGWALPMIAIFLWVRNIKESSRIQKQFSTVLIAEMFVFFVVLGASNRWTFLDPVIGAVMPGVLSGILIGTTSILWIKIYKGTIGQ
jgi:peptidoglycan/LPS O-acetylase OafA/YrhL